jgi:predicted  nucleic acid-binding Zn-ribbon protein
MVLTKGDQKYIADTVNGAVDNLARIVAKGFEQTATKDDIARLEVKIAKLELEIMEVKERVTYIERDIAEIRKGLISRVELDDIWARLSLVEKKLGIVSGK